MSPKDNLTDINEEIRRLRHKVVDAEWEGNTSYADDLRNTLTKLYDLREAGELYIPNF